MQACTIVAANYLAQARVLARSFRQHHPGSRFAILLIDDADTAAAAPDAEIVRLPEINLPPDEEYRMRMIYDVRELSTAVKPWLLRYMQASGDSEVIYFDPDIEIFAPLDDVAQLAAEHSIVIVPHVTEPIPRDGLRPSETDILGAGIYNLGFIAIGSGSEPFLDWWSERLKRDAITDPAGMRFTDQRWIDFVPGLYAPHILRDRGCDVAYWNLHTRRLSYGSGGYQVDGQPLRFFHFSGYDPEQPDRLSKFQEDRPRVSFAANPALRTLCDFYREKLIEAGFVEARQTSYRYAALSDGTPLDACMRYLYREALMRFDRGEGPEPPSAFSGEGDAGFIDWLNEPLTTEPCTVTRYMLGFHELRAELQSAFPHPLERDAQAFSKWFVVHEAPRLGFDHPLIPRESVALAQAARARGCAVEVLVQTGDAAAAASATAFIRALEAAALRHDVVYITEDGSRSDIASHHAEELVVSLALASSADQTSLIEAYLQALRGRYGILLVTEPLETSASAGHQQLARFDELWVAGATAQKATSNDGVQPMLYCDFAATPAVLGSAIRRRVEAIIEGTQASAVPRPDGCRELENKRLRGLHAQTQRDNASLRRESAAARAALLESDGELPAFVAALQLDIKRVERGSARWNAAERLGFARLPSELSVPARTARREIARALDEQTREAAQRLSEPLAAGQAVAAIARLHRTTGLLLDWMNGGWIFAKPQRRQHLRAVISAQLGMSDAAKDGAPRPTSAPPLFDVAYYLGEYEDVAALGADPWQHYLEHGAREDRNPNPLFDSAWYLAENADVAAAGANPLLHFTESGAAEGRDPVPLFDARWYAETNDIGSANPLQHYLERGALRQCDPHPLFRTGWYESQTRASSVNALEHYRACGASHLTNPHPLFDAKWYSRRLPHDEGRRVPPLEHYIRSRGRAADPHPLFSTRWYLAQIDPEELRDTTPLEHYLRFGAAAGRDPHPLFRADYYLRQCPGGNSDRITPLEHYLLHGAQQGCSPHPMFDPAFYAGQHPAIASRARDLLTHYVTIGWKLGFNPSRSFDGQSYFWRRREQLSGELEPMADGADADLDLRGAIGRTIHFGESGDSERYRLHGWTRTEPGFTWTCCESAGLWLPMRGDGTPVILRLTAAALIDPPSFPSQAVQVYADGVRLADWQVGSMADFDATIGGDQARQRTIVIEFRTPDAVSPRRIGRASDPRVLGLCVERLRILPSDV